MEPTDETRPAHSPPIEVRLFGSLEVRDGARVLGPGDLGGVRPKQVLEILLAERGHHVSTARIADRLWGEEQPQDTAAAVQTFVSVLRRVSSTTATVRARSS